MKPEIKRLIDLSCEKGSITSKQKQIIIKKAGQLGDDVDEVEIILENIPVLDNTGNDNKSQTDGNTTLQYGEIKRCPHCGAVVSDYIGKCLDCGYVFRKVQINQSYSELRNKILRYEKELNETGSTSVYQKLAAFIRTIPISSSKADILELMSICAGNIMDPNNGDDYRAKVEECIIKGEALFGNDEQVIQAIHTAKELVKQQKRRALFNRTN